MEPKKQHVVLIRMELILLSSVMMVIIIRLIFLEKRVIVKLFLNIYIYCMREMKTRFKYHVIHIAWSCSFFMYELHICVQGLLIYCVCVNVALCTFTNKNGFVHVLLVRCLFEFLTCLMLFVKLHNFRPFSDQRL